MNMTTETAISHAVADIKASNFSLASRAMLAWLNISVWGGSKKDREISADVADRYKMNGKGGRYTKTLLPNSKALAAIKAFCTTTRNRHYHFTSPWTDGQGPRILVSTAYDKWGEEMRVAQLEFDALVNDFVADWEAHVEVARADLGNAFNEKDYPSATAVRNKFSFEFSVTPIPDSSDFRVSMGDAQIESLKSQIAAQVVNAVSTANRATMNRLIDSVLEMSTKLRQYKPGDKDTKTRATMAFHESLVGNLRDFADLLPDLNVSGDPDIDAFADDIRDQLCGYTAVTLKSDENLREDVAKQADAIAKKAAAFIA